MELLCIIMWKVWCVRNDWVHNGRSFDVNEVVWWSRNYVDEIQRASFNRDKGGAMGSRSREEVNDRWKPSDHGRMKINCEVRVDNRRRRVRYGIIMRDTRGRVLWCSAQGCEANFNLDCAKAMAAFKGLNVEANYGGILEAIHNFSSNVRPVTFQFVSSKANMVALELAKVTLGLSELVVWKDDAPIFIRDLVEAKYRT
ncbi:hypothetical protein LWI29_028585 [Acer saccharum]|uniref:RNase H type-1 domain-containing protein n=1 Tax=Acer saccharum TaxID=4024 RepID=A0AA39VXD6_ACESA|nr:hypothetical protein LWI29_028585 [Acer saccharum]